MGIVPLSILVGYLIDILPMMRQQNIPVLDSHYQVEPNDFIMSRIEMSQNQIRPNCHDATIVIRNYRHMIDGAEYMLKISIFARQCILDNRLQKRAPERTLEIESIIPKDDSKALDDHQKVKLEQELETEICLKWDTHVQSKP
ncbi:MAG: hypothetical protein ACREBB_01435 [Nitrosotalea sp.]